MAIGKRDPPHIILYDYNFEPHEEDFFEKWVRDDDLEVYRLANVPWSMNVLVLWDPEQE